MDVCKICDPLPKSWLFSESRNKAHQSHRINVPRITRTQSLSPGVPMRVLTEWSPGDIFCFQGHKRNICKTQWSCCGDKCYHFSRDFNTFQDSKNICKNMGATLVKIEDEEELVMYMFCFLPHTVFV